MRPTLRDQRLARLQAGLRRCVQRGHVARFDHHLIGFLAQVPNRKQRRGLLLMLLPLRRQVDKAKQMLARALEQQLIMDPAHERDVLLIALACRADQLLVPLHDVGFRAPALKTQDWSRFHKLIQGALLSGRWPAVDVICPDFWSVDFREERKGFFDNLFADFDMDAPLQNPPLEVRHLARMLALPIRHPSALRNDITQALSHLGKTYPWAFLRQPEPVGLLCVLLTRDLLDIEGLRNALGARARQDFMDTVNKAQAAHEQVQMDLATAPSAPMARGGRTRL